MTELYPQPFKCPRCRTMPKAAFAINPVTDDWMILFPDEQLIHIHFGPSTHEVKQNNVMGDFILDWWNKITKEHSGKRLFFINDLTRKDDSEVIEGRMREVLKIIRAHPQDGGGATYGQTYAMSFMLNLVAMFTRRAVNLKKSLAECEAEYELWFSDSSNLTVK